MKKLQTMLGCLMFAGLELRKCHPVDSLELNLSPPNGFFKVEADIQ